MRNILLTTIASCALVITPVKAQTIDEAKQLLDVWLAAQTDYNDWPSISVSFVDDKKVIYSNSFGYANRTTNLKATPDTLYSICSISKLFTSISIMQQRDAGKLTLRDPVSKHLDWYNVEQQYPLSDEVTIEGLLTHSSGLPREVGVPYWSGSEGFPFPSPEEVKEITQDQETLYRAWEYFQYSNLGLTLAGDIVEKTSGEDYHDYVLSNVLAPLGLEDTYSVMPRDKHGNELAMGYSAQARIGERIEVPFFDAKGIGPAAGYASSANDLGKFAMWQLKLQKGEGDDVLNHNTLREMQRPHSVVMGWNRAWGLGFALRNSKGKTTIGHGGTCPGYQTSISIKPDENIGGIALFNAVDTNPSQIISRLMAIFGPILKKAAKDEKSSDKKEEKDKPEVTLTDYQGIYDGQPWSDESYIMPWGDKLIRFSLKSNDPLENMTKFKHVEGDKFARLRDDDTEAEITTFNRDSEGKVISLETHGNFTIKKD